MSEALQGVLGKDFKVPQLLTRNGSLKLDYRCLQSRHSAIKVDRMSYSPFPKFFGG